MKAKQRLSETQRRALAALALPGRALVGWWLMDWDTGGVLRIGYFHSTSLKALLRRGLIATCEADGPDVLRITDAGRAALAEAEA